MMTIKEKAAAALDLLPQELQETAVAYLVEQAEKYQALKKLIAEGDEDIKAGRVVEWNLSDFLRKAHSQRPK
jgi:hypothetical protein